MHILEQWILLFEESVGDYVGFIVGLGAGELAVVGGEEPVEEDADGFADEEGQLLLRKVDRAVALGLLEHFV